MTHKTVYVEEYQISATFAFSQNEGDVVQEIINSLNVLVAQLEHEGLTRVLTPAGLPIKQGAKQVGRLKRI